MLRGRFRTRGRPIDFDDGSDDRGRDHGPERRGDRNGAGRNGAGRNGAGAERRGGGTARGRNERTRTRTALRVGSRGRTLGLRAGDPHLAVRTSRSAKREPRPGISFPAPP
ncbi:hypothetical protein CW362_30220 [Streptomyces populi]|uniref:Uncharacterized protein n=1 Tax=Streptomyces populi TaxID=2058924 RepID=A0A2I0SHF5_9ACTN|nr:hypothetical protein CW362_30220 [Streptomyces populi]